MDRYDSGALAAMLVDATNAAGGLSNPALASFDDLERIARRTDVSASGTNTEPCVKTCGGCRG